MSYNSLTTLADGIFKTLQYIGQSNEWGIKFGISAILNLSHNNLASLPAGIFVILKYIEGTLDFSHNNLTSLKDRMMENLGYIGTTDKYLGQPY